MRYQLRNVRINRGVNSRGQYEWLQAELFNDAQPWANPNRLPRLNSMIQEYINFFKEEGDTNLKEIPEYQVKDSTGKVTLQVFELKSFPKPESIAKMLKAQDPTLSDESALENAKSMLNNAITHVSHVHTVVQPLIGQWQPVYRRDTTVNGKNYPRGSVRVNNQGDPVPAVSSRRVTVLQAYDEDSNQWVDVENPEDIANLLLERGYKRVVQQAAQPNAATSGNVSQESGEALSDAEKAEMQKRIEEMQKQLNG